MTLSGDNSRFEGTYIQSSGTTLVSGKYFGGVSSISGDSILEISSGAEIGDGEIGLYERGQLILSTPNDLEFGGSIRGIEGTKIDKIGAGVLSLSGDNSRFGGTFIQSRGTTIVEGIGEGNAAYFVGVSSISGGVIEFRERSGGIEGVIGGGIELWGEGTFRINRDSEFDIRGQIKGDGRIEKVGTGVLTISGDNSRFEGEFEQVAGTTSVNMGDMFSGIHRIGNSLLAVEVSSVSIGVGNLKLGYKVEISSGGVLEQRTGGTGSYSTEISSESIRFIGDGGKAVFKGVGAGASPRYVLDRGFEDVGEGNEVVFEGSCVDVDGDTYGGATVYRFNEGVIDIDYEGVGVQPGTRTVTFGNFVSSNTKLNTTIHMISTRAAGSMLVAGNNPDGGDSEIELGMVTVGEVDGESGHIESHEVKLLGGAVKFKEGGRSGLATMAYEYEIEVNPADLQGVIVYSTQVTNGESLNKMNEMEGSRALMFSYDDSTHTYYVLGDLGGMGCGEFRVRGHDAFDGESRIVGGGHSLFKVIKDTKFEMSGVEIVEAVGGEGSALCVSTDTARVIVENVGFNSNIASMGGAIYVGGGGKVDLINTKLKGNRAEVGVGGGRSGGVGGGIYIERGVVNVSGGLEIEGNMAEVGGGGIYIKDGELNVIGEVVFRDNVVGESEELNGIYMEGDSRINFGEEGGEGGRVYMYDGIRSEGVGGEININGNTEFNIGRAGSEVLRLEGLGERGRGRIEVDIPNLRINDEGRVNILGKTDVRVRGGVVIGEGGRMEIDGRNEGGMEIEVGERFEQEGLLGMNLYRKNEIGGGLFEDREGDSDIVIVDGGIISLGEKSKLELKVHDAFSDCEGWRWRVFKLMKYGQMGGCNGEFGQVKMIGGESPRGYIMMYDYLGEYVALFAEGLGENVTRIAASWLDLCYNQTQTAETLDYFCREGYQGDPGLHRGVSESAKKLGDKIIEISGKLGDGSADGGPDKDIEGLKEILYDLSGYFISNVIMSMGNEDERKDIYKRIYNRENVESEKGIWGQVRGEIGRVEKDIESPERIGGSEVGIVAGFDMMTSTRGMIGVYVKEKKRRIEQGKEMHKADIRSIGAGVYGRVGMGRYDIKGMGIFSNDEYETSRNIRFEGRRARGEFGGKSAKVEVECGYSVGIWKNRGIGEVEVRPYVGGGISYVETNGFRERGGDIWDLEVKRNKYVRGDVRGGVGFSGGGKRYRWNGTCGVGCIVGGKREEIRSKFMGGNELNNGVSNREFGSRSVTLGAMSVIGEIGGGYYIREGLEGYCGVEVRIGRMEKDVSGNVGIRYSFGKREGKKEEEKKEEVVEEKKVVEVKTGNEKIKQFRINDVPDKTGPKMAIDKNISKTKVSKSEVVGDRSINVDESVKSGEIKQFKINAVLFEFDKADIKPEAEKEIRELAKKIGNEYKYEKIRIEGHTDSYGSDEYNKKLSMARADAVHEVFAKNGIEVAKIEKIGHGESKPIDSNKNKKGRANNRRVEIFIDLY
jgi:outer membrane protein OmpA-like peptidoglycan-associated protein